MVEIRRIYEFEGLRTAEGWWARGHIDPEEFCAAIREQDPHAGFTPNPSAVKHERWRFCPVREPEFGGFYMQADMITRGSFPVTTLVFWACREPVFTRFADLDTEVAHG